MSSSAKSRSADRGEFAPESVPIEPKEREERQTAASSREFLTDVRVRASNILTEYVCGHWDRNDPEYPDPADVHEDVREALWPFFLEIRDRFGVKGDV